MWPQCVPATRVVTEHSDVTETTAGRCSQDLLYSSATEVTGYQQDSLGSIPDRGNIFPSAPPYRFCVHRLRSSQLSISNAWNVRPLPPLVLASICALILHKLKHLCLRYEVPRH